MKYVRQFPIAILLLTISASAAAGLEISRAKADELLAKEGNDDPWLKSKDASTLAWNEAYTITALLDLYEATSDAKYLRDAVAHSDRMISHRDDKRGFVDASGISRKRWSIGTKYTVAEGTLVDADGKPAIKLRSTLFAYNSLTKVTVTSAGNTFSIHITNSYWKRDETFADLSMDPKNPRCFASIINDDKPRARPFCDPGKCTEASQLLRATPIGDHPPVPKEQSFSLQALWISHVGYVGIICQPMLRLALLVKDDPALQPEFAAARDRLTAAAEECFDDLQSSWRNGPRDDEGYFVGCVRGGPDAYDNIGEAFNYQAKLCCSQLLLYQLTNKPIYKERATRIANLFKHRLKTGPDDTYIWNYWYEPVTTGWTAADNISDNTPNHAPWLQEEDTSHGALDIEGVVASFNAGIVYDAADLQRFANTFLFNVVLPDRSGFWAHVNRTDANSRYKDTRVAAWLGLTQADPRVLELARTVYDNRGVDDFRTVAAILKWQHRLASPKPR